MTPRRNGLEAIRKARADGRRAPGRAIPLVALGLGLSLSGCIDDTVSQLVFTPPSGGNRSAFSYAAVTVGGSVNCLLTDGGKARCWGDGPLGNGGDADSARPVSVTGGTSFLEISLAGGLRCGLSTNRIPMCWGSNVRGAFGDGTTDSSDIPVEAQTDLRFTAISANGGSVCGIALDEALYCWGRNVDGELGIGVPDTIRLAPAAVAGGLTFRSIALGFFQTCAIATDGAPYCWGRHWGDAPQAVPTSVRFVAVSGDSETFCGLTESGEAWCWGENNDGEFGNGERDESPDVYHKTPVPVLTDLRFSQISVGGRHACGIDSTTEAVYCWGRDTNGQLGDGTRPGDPERALTPVRVQLGRRFTHISVGSATSCATTTESTAFCWGWMVGGTTFNDVPVEVG